MQLYVIAGLIFAMMVAAFAVQNSSAVDIKFLAWNFADISLVLVILGSVVGGALIAILLGLPKQLRNMMKIRDLTAQNQRLIAEVDRLNQEAEQVKESEAKKTVKTAVNDQG